MLRSLLVALALLCAAAPAQAQMLLLGAGRAATVSATPPVLIYAGQPAGGSNYPNYQLTGGQSIPAGSVVEVWTLQGTSATISGFSDDKGNTYANGNADFVGSPAQYNWRSGQSLITTPLVAGDRIGANLGANGGGYMIIVWYPSGIATGSTGATATSGVSGSINYNTGTLPAAPAWVSICVFGQSTAGSIVTPGGWTNTGSAITPNFGIRHYYQRVTSTSAVNFTTTLSSGPWSINYRSLTSN